MSLIEGHFYFLIDQYYLDFPDPNITQGKGEGYKRPCFYAFPDKNTGLFWMIPFSSKVEKFELIYNKKLARYGTPLGRQH